MSETRVAVLVGSLRADSVNRKLAELLRDQAPEGVTVDIVDGLDELPFYNEDLDGDRRPRRGRGRCASGSAGADRVLAVTPEYNGTMPAVLNNAIDWLSRPYGAGALTGKPFGVVGATPTPYGGKWAHDDTLRSAAHRRCGRRRGRRPSRSPSSRSTCSPTPRCSARLHDAVGPARRLRRRRPSPPDGCRRGLAFGGVAELHDLTALEQGELVRRREVSPLELAEHYLERAHRVDRPSTTVGAFVTLTADLARARARASSRPWSAGPARRCTACRPPSRTST